MSFGYSTRQSPEFRVGTKNGGPLESDRIVTDLEGLGVLGVVTLPNYYNRWSIPVILSVYSITWTVEVGRYPRVVTT